MTFITGLIGAAGFLIFLGIMVWWVQAIPLIIIVAVVSALMIYDWVQTVRFGDNWTKR